MVMISAPLAPPVGNVQAHPAALGLDRAASRRNRVLVVESDRALRDAVTGALAVAVPVQGARTGYEARRMLDEFIPTIVVMNLQLDDSSGLDLLRLVRDRLSGSKVIVTSDSGDSELVDRVTALGVCDFLEKPYSTVELFRSLENSVRGISSPIDDRILAARYHEKSRLRLRSLLMNAAG